MRNRDVGCTFPGCAMDHPNPSSPGAPDPAEVRRHGPAARLLHWLLAASFILVMATGLALYWRSILGWTLPLFGGKDSAVNLHFWTGLVLAAAALLLFLVWRRLARWTPTDSHFVRHLSAYAASPDQVPPPETGFFNGGQKLYFWSVMVSTVIFVVTGLVWWFRKEVPQNVYAVCRTTHRVLAVIMSAGFLVHVYKATIGEAGTFGSMVTGKVTVAWARARRPNWYRELGGRD